MAIRLTCRGKTIFIPLSPLSRYLFLSPDEFGIGFDPPSSTDRKTSSAIYRDRPLLGQTSTVSLRHEKTPEFKYVLDWASLKLSHFSDMETGPPILSSCGNWYYCTIASTKTVNTPNLTFLTDRARFSAATIKSLIQEKDCQYASSNRWLSPSIKHRLAHALAVLYVVQGRPRS